MVSPEFRIVVKEKNVLRARIMMKDSLIVDPTFSQFNEMLSYAQAYIPEIIVPFDGEQLETDTFKWSKELMNMELVQLIGNFSEQRILHLKKIISFVFTDNIQKHKNTLEKKKERQDALFIISCAGNDIEKIMKKTREKGTWNSSDVASMESATKKMMDGIKKYNENR